MKKYEEYLALQEEADLRRKNELFKRYCRGWVLGSEEFRNQLKEELLEQPTHVEWEGEDFQELKEDHWERVAQAELNARGKNEDDITSTAKGADWKVVIARGLREKTTASNPWIARRLNMGHPSRVSNLIRDPKTFKFYV